jgi:integrase
VAKKRVSIPGVSIWKPKGRPRARYRITYYVPCTPYTDAGGRVRTTRAKTVTASTDLQATVELAAQHSSRRERIRVGLAAATDERYATEDRKPVRQHLADYRDALKAAGRDAKHVNQMHDSAGAVLLGTPADRLARKGRRRPMAKLDGVGAARVSEIVASLVQREIGKVKEQRSAATANRYLDAVNGFLNWGVQDGRWAANPVKHLPKYNVEADRRHVRRSVSVADLIRLLESTAAGPVREGYTGEQRAMAYTAAAVLGLRRKEMKKLLVADCLFAGPRPGVWSEARHAKARKRVFIQVPPFYAELFAKYLESRPVTDAAFPMSWNAARGLRADLAAAGIPYEVNGKVFDFHGLRHQMGAMLVSAGVNLKAVQQRMRHGSIRMTLDTYGHVTDDDASRAAAAIPNLRPDKTPNAGVCATRGATGSDKGDVRSGSFGGSSETTAMAGQKTRSEQWSDGESNPDLLNAIQHSAGRVDLRKSKKSRGLRRMIEDGEGEAVAQRAARVLRMLQEQVGIMTRRGRARKGGRR